MNAPFDTSTFQKYFPVSMLKILMFGGDLILVRAGVGTEWKKINSSQKIPQNTIKHSEFPGFEIQG